MTDEASSRWIRELYHQTKGSAAKRKIPFSLSYDDLSSMVSRSGLCCEITGIPFNLQIPRVALGLKHYKRPWFPSVDRIDSTKGYHRGNVRLVCVAVNYALGAFGDEVFLRILDAGRTDRRSILQARYAEITELVKQRQREILERVVAESSIPGCLTIKSDLLPKARAAGSGPPCVTGANLGQVARYYLVGDVAAWLDAQGIEYQVLVPADDDLMLDDRERLTLWMRQLERRIGQLETENRQLRKAQAMKDHLVCTVEKLQKETYHIRDS